MGVGRGLGEVRHWMGNQPRISCFIGLYFYFFQCLTKLGLQSTPCPILAKTSVTVGTVYKTDIFFHHYCLTVSLY